MKPFAWTSSADRQQLAQAGYEVVEFAAVSAARVRDASAVAVVGVRLETVADVARLHGHVLEPAWRHGTPVLVESAHKLSRLAPERFVDEGFEHPYSLERALDVALRLHRGAGAPPEPRDVPPSAVALDPEQRRAADAHDGVVQVIAPAGSG